MLPEILSVQPTELDVDSPNAEHDLLDIVARVDELRDRHNAVRLEKCRCGLQRILAETARETPHVNVIRFHAYQLLAEINTVMAATSHETQKERIPESCSCSQGR